MAGEACRNDRHKGQTWLVLLNFKKEIFLLPCREARRGVS